MKAKKEGSSVHYKQGRRSLKKSPDSCSAKADDPDARKMTALALEAISPQSLGFDCQMQGIMDKTAEGKMERCVQPATQTCKLWQASR
ncbi:hypothetical protein PFLUV_G00058650 [Perca fluviatilis]|uniref:Uncharacterized protein n=1 Tax=Perca fluviatilis TaxID=8168 RepID=A0A6A5FJ92_PERFL|nr:hypothetical protein PFLUV_G00058650 [Perca fluviatilis]